MRRLRVLILATLLAPLVSLRPPAAAEANAAAAPPAPAPAGFDETVRPFLARHCFECHGEQKAKGDLRLDTLGTDFANKKQAAAWDDVRRQLRDGEMPPKKATQPAAAAKQGVLAWLETQMQTAGRSGPVVRRLNRVEYENTLRDLLDMPGLEVKELLPPEGTNHGFDTVASTLDISHVQMLRYLEIAELALAQTSAFGLKADRPQTATVRHHPQHARDWWHRAGQGATIPLAENGPDPWWNKDTGGVDPKSDPHALPPVRAMGTLFHSDASGLLRLTNDRRKVAAPGLYRLRVSAYAFDWDKGAVLPAKAPQSYSVATATRTLGYFDAPKDKPAVSEVVTWLEPTDEVFFNAVTLCHGHGSDRGAATMTHPGVAVEWMDVEGPLLESWPTPGRQRLYGDLPLTEWPADSKLPKPRRPAVPNADPNAKFYTVASSDPSADAGRLLRAFMTRACRRPVTDAEIQPFLRLFQAKLAEPTTFEEALRTAYKAVLTSSQFLFLRHTPGEPDLYALASRLSYFLWSSMPDDELTRCAADGSLGNPDVLRAQTERLLNHPKARNFVVNFTGQWLKLRDINATQPDRQLYPEEMWEQDVMAYTVDSMVDETRTFFDNMVRKDLSVSYVIDSPTTFLNEPLAKLYGIPGVEGAAMREVTLPPDARRGGIMSHASCLKVSANGTTTSPVLRGVWVTTRLLGRDIPPPPPNTGGVEPDLRGATTIREQLDKHRSDPSCASCHVRMDPPGFALEGYDVVGGRRDRYRILKDNGLNREGPAIDASGHTAEGKPFKDLAELKTILLQDKDPLARNLATKLLTYATGREPGGADAVEVDEIVTRVRAKDYGVRSLIHEVVQSNMMRGQP